MFDLSLLEGCQSPCVAKSSHQFSTEVYPQYLVSMALPLYWFSEEDPL